MTPPIHRREGWECLLPFDTDDPEFTRGFEMGRLWQRAQTSGEIQQLIHAQNAEMAMRVAEATGRSFSAEPVNDMWVKLTLSDGSGREGHDG